MNGTRSRSLRRGSVFLAVGLLTTVMACSPTPSEPEDEAATGEPTEASEESTEPVELQFLGAEAVETFQPAIDAFQAAHPNVTITYNSVPFAQFTSTIQARMASKDATLDVYMADEPRVPYLASSGYLTPWPGDPASLDEVLNENDIEAVTWDDQVWSLPMWTSSQVLYYNKALLGAAGVEEPSADPADRLTWEDLVERGAKAQAAGAKWGFSFQQVDRYYQLQTLPESLGGGPGLVGDDLLTPDLTNDGWLQAMEWYGSIFESGVSPRGIDVGQIPELFLNGELAFMVGTPVYVSQFAGAPDLDWGVAPMPAFEDGEPMTPTDGWSLGVSPYSENQDVAWEFAEFLTLDEAGSLTTIQGRPYPSANKGTMTTYLSDLPDLAGGKAPELPELLQYELENTAIHRPRTVGYVAFEESMNKAFADIRNGSDTADRLGQAQSELESAFGRLAAG